jgi:adenosine kinase
MSDIIVTGSVANDYIMGFPGDFREHILPDKIDVLSVSFLVDSLRREPGGCAANIGFNLAMLGEHPRVMATVGLDWAPDRRRLEAMGVDCSLVRAVEDAHTSSFFVSTDDGNRQIANFYVGAMGRATDLSLHDLSAEEIARIGAVIISPNAPEAMVKLVQECRDLKLPYVYDPSQQIVRLSGEQLRDGIDGCRLLIANEYEAELIRDKTGMGETELRAAAGILIITHGENGSVIWENGDHHEVPIVATEEACDPTGVGDAYRAGVLIGLLRDIEWPVAGRVGALCATYALESLGTQNHPFSTQDFLSRYTQHFGPAPAALTELFARRSAAASA